MWREIADAWVGLPAECSMETAPGISYEFLAPQRIVFGWGSRRQVGPLARSLGRRAFLVCGARALADRGALDEIVQALKSAEVEAVPVATIEHEPEVADVDGLAAHLRGLGIEAGDFLLALGGGAAMDLAKAAAAMAVQHPSTSVRDYLENVGRNLPLAGEPLPVLAMPTTAGTGAEATRNAVISCYDPPFKKSLRWPKILPRVALVDPELTVSVPPAVTAASGMDAVTQLIESYISRKSRPIPRALAVDGLRHALPWLAEAVENGTNPAAREHMAHAALVSGMALANSGLGMAHGVAAALGVHARVPHGVACALLLPVALRVNMPVCADDLGRLAQWVDPRYAALRLAEAAEAFARDIAVLAQRVGIPARLSQVGVRADQLPAIVRDSRGSSMSGNPRDLSDDELTRILEEIL